MIAHLQVLNECDDMRRKNLLVKKAVVTIHRIQKKRKYRKKNNIWFGRDLQRLLILLS